MNWTVRRRNRALGICAAILAGFPQAQASTARQSLPSAEPASTSSAPADGPSITSATAPSTQTVSKPPQGSPGPESSPGPEELGDILAARQRYQAAIEAYKRAPQDSAEVWNKMGIAYQLLYDLPDATRCYLTSLKIDPRNASVLNNLGTTYDALRQYGESERMYRRALKIEPRSAVVLKNLGTSQMAERRYKQGWQSYQAALAIDPHIFEQAEGPQVGNPSSIQSRGAMNFYMAKTCVRAGMKDRAIEFLRLALNEGFTNPKKIGADREFAALHGIPAFEKMLAAQNPQ